jgi:hypothetical protein
MNYVKRNSVVGKYLLMCTAWWRLYKPKHVAYYHTIKTNKLIIHYTQWNVNEIIMVVVLTRKQNEEFILYKLYFVFLDSYLQTKRHKFISFAVTLYRKIFPSLICSPRIRLNTVQTPKSPSELCSKNRYLYQAITLSTSTNWNMKNSFSCCYGANPDDSSFPIMVLAFIFLQRI